MTVGLVLNNRDYGVALADSMVTIGDYRKGDTANKLLHINAKNFYGAMVGAGDAMNIFAAFEDIKDKTFREPKKMLEALRNFSLEYQLNADRQAVESQMKIEEIAKKYHSRREDSEEDGNEGEESEEEPEDDMFGFKKRKKSILGGLEDYLTSDFVTAIYDKKEQRVRKYFINAAVYIEDPIFETAIGSGSDSAGLELMRLISGAPLGKLHKCEIAFFALCAYVRATQNVGVGGIPKMALIDKQGATVVSRENSIALANIVSAYHADLIPRSYAEHNAELVLRGQGRYEEVAKAIGMNGFVLKNHLVPLDSWLNLANNLRYSPKEPCKCNGKCREKGKSGKGEGCKNHGEKGESK